MKISSSSKITHPNNTEITAHDIYHAIDEIAPFKDAFSFDNAGLQVGTLSKKVTKCMFSLDRSLAAIKQAVQLGCECMVTHHPLIWDPLKKLDLDSHIGKSIELLIKNDITLISAHTNWDISEGGINDTLASILQLENIEHLGCYTKSELCKLVLFIPHEDMNQMIDALSNAGAGVIENYRRCAFYQQGTGTFLPSEGSEPVIGKKGRVELVEEIRLEMVFRKEDFSTITKTLLAHHPYETPAYDVYPLSHSQKGGTFRCGYLKNPCQLSAFLSFVNLQLETQCRAWGRTDRVIRKVAVCGGAGGSFWKEAKKSGCDVLVSSEIKQDIALEAVESDFCIVDAGHFATEQPGCYALKNVIQELFPKMNTYIYSPDLGLSGKPL